MKPPLPSALCCILLLPLLFWGCASGSGGTDRGPAGTPQLPYPPERSPKVGDILHLPTGTFVDEGQMLAVASDARIVYVGETHDNPASHRFQLRVLESMADRYPGEIALGLEMMVPEQQTALDLWVAGELSEKEFLKRSGWYDQWKMDFAYYRDLFQFARSRQIPIIGLNAPKSLVRAVARKTAEELSAEQREQLPQMDLGDPYQRSLVEAVYRGHEEGESQLVGFLRVQTLWDEKMAESIVHYLESPQGEDRRMVVLAGGNHVRHGFGIPRRVFRRLPTSYALLGTKEISIPSTMRDRQMDVEIPEFPMPAYDFMAFVEYEELEGEKVRLGVLLEERENGGVILRKVLPDSAAEAAGLQSGDLVLTFDGEAVEDNFDIIYAVGRKAPGDRATLRIDRNGEERELEVLFRRSSDEKTE